MRRDKSCRSNEQILSYFSPFVSHFDDPPQNKIKQINQCPTPTVTSQRPGMNSPVLLRKKGRAFPKFGVPFPGVEIRDVKLRFR